MVVVNVQKDKAVSWTGAHFSVLVLGPILTISDAPLEEGGAGVVVVGSRVGRGGASVVCGVGSRVGRGGASVVCGAWGGASLSLFGQVLHVTGQPSFIRAGESSQLRYCSATLHEVIGGFLSPSIPPGESTHVGCGGLAPPSTQDR